MTTVSNFAAAVDAPTPSRLHLVALRRRATDQRCYASMRLFGLCLLIIAVTSCGQKAKQDAETLDGFLGNGGVDHFACSGLWPEPGWTNNYDIKRAPSYFPLFDASNRLQISSDAFYKESPGRVVFFRGTNAIVSLGYGNHAFAFRDYYFRLKTPTNFHEFFLPL
jgi:hypothetical protein